MERREMSLDEVIRRTDYTGMEEESWMAERLGR